MRPLPPSLELMLPPSLRLSPTSGDDSDDEVEVRLWRPLPSSPGAEPMSERSDRSSAREVAVPLS